MHSSGHIRPHCERSQHRRVAFGDRILSRLQPESQAAGQAQEPAQQSTHETNSGLANQT